MSNIITGLKNVVLLKGDINTAYRDPAVIYADGVFHIFYTLVTTENGVPYLRVAKSTTTDLVNITPPQVLTEKDRSKNFSSPGNIIRYNGRWKMCVQTYCRENGEKYGNDNSRIYSMDSDNLYDWSQPRLLRVKGEAPIESMGRMIDPYFVQDIKDSAKWWCLYKQNGVSMSYTYDFEKWTYHGAAAAGENVCVVEKDGEYYMFHSPHNGIGVMKSRDFEQWESWGELITLRQDEWEWTKGRITAGFVLDLTKVEGVGKYLLFFHGTGPQDESVVFDNYACIGIAWSDDLIDWQTP